MTYRHQVILVAFAIAFAIALAVTVALICIDAVARDNEPTEEPIYPPEWTFPYVSDESPLTGLLPAVTAPVASEEPVGIGLCFQSNRDGTCTLVGIGSCEDAFVVIPEYSPSNDRVTAVAAGALRGCESVAALQIPKTVCYIGDLAFADCPNLLYVSVSRDNPAYTDLDGVLYTKDGSCLLLYPAMRAGSSVQVSSNVTSIGSMAFYNCAYLCTVLYEGSAEEWHRIAIGAKNYSLTAASVIYSSRELS